MKKIIADIKNILMKDENVIFAYLYGSVARGDSHKFSDIDIAVFFKEPVTENYNKLLKKIALSVKAENIDTRPMDHMPPLLQYRIIKEGRVLVDKDKSFREKVVFLTLVVALDIKECIKQYRKDRLESFLNAN